MVTGDLFHGPKNQSTIALVFFFIIAVYTAILLNKTPKTNKYGLILLKVAEIRYDTINKIMHKTTYIVLFSETWVCYRVTVNHNSCSHTIN